MIPIKSSSFSHNSTKIKLYIVTPSTVHQSLLPLVLSLHHLLLLFSAPSTTTVHTPSKYGHFLSLSLRFLSGFGSYLLRNGLGWVCVFDLQVGMVGVVGEDNSSSLPQWLPILLGEKFFTPCLLHSSHSKRNEKTFFCLCCCSAICFSCFSSHRSHALLQVYSNPSPANIILFPNLLA